MNKIIQTILALIVIVGIVIIVYSIVYSIEKNESKIERLEHNCRVKCFNTHGCIVYSFDKETLDCDISAKVKINYEVI